jgi:hypothetical protein
MIQKSITELIEEADQRMAAEILDKNEGPLILKFQSAIRQLAAYKKWYCKRNQPNNYIRITRIIPPGFEDIPHFWIQKLQVWSKNLIVEDQIDAMTFDYIRQLPDWEKNDSSTMLSYRWKNPLLNNI